jgi:hypothetical protein
MPNAPTLWPELLTKVEKLDSHFQVDPLEEFNGRLKKNNEDALDPEKEKSFKARHHMKGRLDLMRELLLTIHTKQDAIRKLAMYGDLLKFEGDIYLDYREDLPEGHPARPDRLSEEDEEKFFGEVDGVSFRELRRQLAREIDNVVRQLANPEAMNVGGSRRSHRKSRRSNKKSRRSHRKSRRSQRKSKRNTWL